jgi:hypothetical protein
VKLEGPVLALPGIGLLGFTVALEAQATLDGVRVIVSVKDPRDRTGKIHRADFVLPTARATAPPRGEEALPPS